MSDPQPHCPNHLHLGAGIVAMASLRETPAGISALDLQLEHSSEQDQGLKARRSIRLRLQAVAFGELARRLARQALGSQWVFQGFVAAARNGRGLVLHIQDAQAAPFA